MKHLDDKVRTAPDILDCIANLSSDEVFTPPRMAKQMLNLLPKEVWSDPNLKWLDPSTKTGIFLREIAQRLMDGLSSAIPNENARREHIYKNMLYGLPITELTSMLSRRSVYYSKDADSERYAVVRMGSSEGNIPLIPTSHSFKSGSCNECGAPESLERGEARENYAYAFIHPDQLPKEFKDMKFDVIVGNPPYQIGVEGNNRDKPLYHLFVQAAVEMRPKHIVMITPSRWFAGGLGLDKYRASMLSDRRLKRIVDYPDASECFPGVYIRGGVSYFHWSRDYDGLCEVQTIRGGVANSPADRKLDEHDVFVRFNEALSILTKVEAERAPNMSEVVSSRVPFGFQGNFSDYKTAPGVGSVALHLKGKKVAWVDESQIVRNNDLIGKFKVLMNRAYGESGSAPFPIIARPLVAEPGSVCTDTYLVCNSFDSFEEAQNLVAYLKTRLVRFLLWLRMNTQDISKSRFAFIPQLDMSITWTDEMLFERYSISEDEILFIKSQIKEMP